MPERSREFDETLTAAIRRIATDPDGLGQKPEPIVPTEPTSDVYRSAITNDNERVPTSPAEGGSSRIRSRLVDKIRHHKIATGLVVVALAIGARGCIGGEGDDTEALVTEGTTHFVTPTAPEAEQQSTETSVESINPDQPLFENFNQVDTEDTLTESTIAATTSTSTTSTTPSTTTSTSTTTTTLAPTTTVPVVAPPAPTIQPAPPTTESNPYALLLCPPEADSVVMQRDWTFSEIASNCEILESRLRSYNTSIANFDNIMTGTVIYLAPGLDSGSRGSTTSNGEFDCWAYMGREYEVLRGENPYSFLMRIITSHGYSEPDADKMIKSGKLVGHFNLDEGAFLYGTKRCAPRADAYDVLFGGQF